MRIPRFSLSAALISLLLAEPSRIEAKKAATIPSKGQPGEGGVTERTGERS